MVKSFRDGARLWCTMRCYFHFLSGLKSNPNFNMLIECKWPSQSNESDKGRLSLHLASNGANLEGREDIGRISWPMDLVRCANHAIWDVYWCFMVWKILYNINKSLTKKLVPSLVQGMYMRDEQDNAREASQKDKQLISSDKRPHTLIRWLIDNLLTPFHQREAYVNHRWHGSVMTLCLLCSHNKLGAWFQKSAVPLSLRLPREVSRLFTTPAVCPYLILLIRCFIVWPVS